MMRLATIGPLLLGTDSTSVLSAPAADPKFTLSVNIEIMSPPEMPREDEALPTKA